jgi:hypothetical protein
MGMNLDPSLAFTALLEMWPDWDKMTADESHALTGELATDMSKANPPDRFAFARGWIRARFAGQKLAEEDNRSGPPYVVPMGIDTDYDLALAIANSAHPSRVLANTNVYRYGRFTIPFKGVVDVHMFGQHIARFQPNAVEFWTCGYATPSTTEALSNLCSTGWFYTDKGQVKYRSYSAPSQRPDTPFVEGSSFHYIRKTIPDTCARCGC